MAVGTPWTGAGETAIYVSDTVMADSSDGDALAGAAKCTVARKVDMVETTAQGQSAKTFIPSMTEYGLTIEGVFERGDTAGDAIRAAFAARSPIFVGVIEDPTASAGSQGQCYSCLVTEDPFDYDVNGVSTRKISLVLTDAPTAFDAA